MAARSPHDYKTQSLNPITDLFLSIKYNQNVHMPNFDQIEALMYGEPLIRVEYENKGAYLHFSSPEVAIGIWRDYHQTFENLGMNLKFAPNKRDLFFSNVSPDIRAELRLDSESLFSVTDDKTADTQTKIAIELYRSSTGNQLKTILDATAAVGGNTISFANAGLAVLSNEIDEGRYKLLNHNLKVLGFGDQDVETYNYDFFKFFETGLYDVQVIFFDPPWGGIDYKKDKNVDLYLGEDRMANVIERCFDSFESVDMVMLKGPVPDAKSGKGGTNQDLLQEKFDGRMVRIDFQKMGLWVIFRNSISKVPSIIYTFQCVLGMESFEDGKWKKVENVKPKNTRPVRSRLSRFTRK